MNIKRPYIIVLIGCILVAFSEHWFGQWNIWIGLSVGLIGVLDYWWWKKKVKEGEFDKSPF